MKKCQYNCIACYGINDSPRLCQIFHIHAIIVNRARESISFIVLLCGFILFMLHYNSNVCMFLRIKYPLLLERMCMHHMYIIIVQYQWLKIDISIVDCPTQEVIVTVLTVTFKYYTVIESLR